MSYVESLGGVKASTATPMQQYEGTTGKDLLTAQAVKKTDSSSKLTPENGDGSINRAQLEEDVDLLNDMGSAQPPSLEFSIDDVTGKTIVRMLDRETEEVLRQIPGEDFMAIARIIRENGESLTDRPGQWVELDA